MQKSRILKTCLKKEKLSNKNTRNDHVKWSRCVHAHFFLPSQKITFRSGFVHTYIPEYIRYTHRDKLCRKKTVVYLPLPRYGNVYQHFERFSRKIVYKNRKEEDRKRARAVGNRMQRDLVRETETEFRWDSLLRKSSAVGR